MILDERQLGVILQASIDRAREMIEGAGGFLPFGARATVSGDVEFLETEGDGGGAGIEALYRRIAAILTGEARRDELLASALVANASLPGGFEGGFETAIAVQVESEGFCRSILVPYRIGPQAVELGKLIPEEAEPLIFAG